MQVSASDDEDESEEVGVLDFLGIPGGFLGVEILLVKDFCRPGDVFPEVLPFLESSSSEEDEDVTVRGCVFRAGLVDFVGTFAFLVTAGASSSDEDESEEDCFCVFFAVKEFVMDFGDDCSLGVLVLLHVFELALGFGDFFTGTFSSSEDVSEEEVFLAAGGLDAATCACLDLGGGF